MKGDLDGILIGQAAIGNPRIFTPHTPSKKEIKETILKHLDYMIYHEEYYQQQKEKFDGTLVMPSSKMENHGKLSDKLSEIMICAFRKHLFQYIK
jgi:tRNA-dihydrouridine synthase